MLRKLTDIVCFISDFSIWVIGIGCLFIAKSIYYYLSDDEFWKFNGMLGLGLCFLSTFFSMLSIYLIEKERIYFKKIGTIEFYYIFSKLLNAPTKNKWTAFKVKDGWEIHTNIGVEKIKLIYIENSDFAENLVKFLVDCPSDIVKLLDSYRSECDCECLNEK